MLSCLINSEQKKMYFILVFLSFCYKHKQGTSSFPTYLLNMHDVVFCFLDSKS